MKKIIPFLLFITSICLLQGCLKDNCTKTYTMYTPVYKTSAEVRANIKSTAPTKIEKTGKLVVLGNYIFLNEVDKGIHIIDNTNPATPVNKHFISIPGNIDIAIKGSILYADLYTDLVTLDISTPDAVRVTNITDDVFEHRRYVNFAADTSRIIVEWIKKDTTVTMECANTWQGRGGVLMDVRNTFSLSSSASPAIGVAGSMARFTILNNFLYTVTNSWLNVFNITTSAQPAFTNKINVGWGIETIYPFANNLFIGSTNGMFVYGTANPSVPNQLSRFTHAMACDPVIADNNFAFVTLRTGTNCNGQNNQLDVINIQNINSPSLVRTYQLVNPHGLAKAGNTLLVCDGSAGLKAFNAADVNNLVLMQTVAGINAYDVIIINQSAIVVAKEGLYQYNISNPFDIKLISRISLN